MRSADRCSGGGPERERRARSSIEVRVWWAHVREATAARELDCLDADERTRLARFVSDLAADRFLLGSALARTAVWSATGIPPASVPLDRTCRRCGRLHGAPRIGGAASGLSLSITHAGRLVGVALCADAEVGLDVEPTSSRAEAPFLDVLAELRPALHPCETGELQALPPASRAAAALRMWTRKEAVLKATRLGLTVALDRLRVSIAGPPRVVEWSGRPADAPCIAVMDLSPAADHVAALACVARTAGDRSAPTIAVAQADGAELLGAWTG